MPQFQQDFLQNTLLPFATEISQREYTPYTGEMTAAVPETTMQAQQFYDVAGGISQMTPEQYAARTQANMNPYQQQVIDASLARMARERDIARTGEMADITRAGAFGNIRRGVYEGERQAAYELGRDQMIADLLRQGYSQAQAQTMAQLQQQQGAAQQAAAGYTDLGRLQQATQQAELDAAYREFMREQDMPLQNLGALTTAAGGVPAMTGTTTQTSSPGLIGYLGAAGALGQGLAALSDRRLKKNITPLAEVNGVKYYTWEWNDAAKAIGAGEQPRSGVIADELKEIHPDLVFRGDDGYLRVDYAGLNERQKEFA
jgi:hypothetical protein